MTRPAEGLPLTLKSLVVCAALATGLVAVWLLMVVATVLPVRDPSHVPMWTAVAFAFLLYAGLTLWFVSRRSRVPALSATVAIASLGALAFGVYAVGNMIAAARSGAHFEGYLLLMGIVVGSNGVTALLSAVLTETGAARV